MIIPITLASDPYNSKLPSGLAKVSHDELVLIELQGTLEVESTHPSDRNGKLVGTLRIDEAMNKPTLSIGHHLLEGKITALPKPLAILHRSSSGRGAVSTSGNAEDAQVEDAMDIDGMGAADLESRPGWTIVGLVKKKIIFSKRPTPVTLKK